MKLPDASANDLKDSSNVYESKKPRQTTITMLGLLGGHDKFIATIPYNEKKDNHLMRAFYFCNFIDFMKRSIFQLQFSESKSLSVPLGA